MIVECPSCQTRFELGDTMAHERRTRVRCSRCRHTFSLFESSTPAMDASSPVQPREEVHPERVEADPEGRGDLSDCFDAAVEEDRRDSSVATAGQEGAPPALEPGCEAMAGNDAPAPEAEASVAWVTPPGAEDPVDPSPSQAGQDDGTALEPVSRGEDAPAAAQSAPPPLASKAYRVARPPRPQPVANLIGWLAVSLLCLVGLFRGL